MNARNRTATTYPAPFPTARPRNAVPLMLGFLMALAVLAGSVVIQPEPATAAARKPCNMRAEFGHANLAAEAPQLVTYERDRMAGEHAALIQAFLAAHLGLDIDSHVDGWWGPETRLDLLLPFQRRYFSGSDVDGIAGPQVYQKISDLFEDKPVRFRKGSYATFRMPSIKGGHTDFTFRFNVGRQGKWRIPGYNNDAPRRCGYRNLNREAAGGTSGAVLMTSRNADLRPTVPASGSDGSYTGGMSSCPVSGTVSLGIDWLAWRSGGRNHQGNDIFASTGTPVLAPATGWAWFTVNAGREGNSFRINSEDGSHYYFGSHMNSITDTTPRRVVAGEQLGTVGQTGNAYNTPPHLHFEIGPQGRFGKRINPRPLLQKLCQT